MTPGSSLEELLRGIGPIDSGRLLKALAQLGLSPEAARKRLSRARKPVRLLAGLTLPDRARFWFLHEQAGTERYWTQLVRALTETGSAYGTALHGLHARGGAVPALEFPVVSGCPALPRRGQLTAQAVEGVLDQIGFLRKIHDPTLGVCLALTRHTPLQAEPHSRKMAIDLAETLVLESFADWAAHLGLITARSVRLRRRAPVPEIAGYYWDLCAPTYLSPFQTARSTGRKTAHGFLVADVILGRRLSSQHCRHFVKKCEGTKAQRGVPPVLPVLIADAFDKDALGEGKKRGFIYATPRTLFGDEIADALRSLISTLSSVTAQAIEPAKVDHLMRALAKTERAADQLRGPLFELLVAHCLSRSHQAVAVGRNVEHPQTGERADIDVLAVEEGVRVVACECKGRRADGTVSLDEVEDWLFRQVPRIYAFVQDHPEYRQLRCVFEFWTTGQFAPDALALLERHRAEVRRYDLRWKDRRAVELKTKELRLAAISKILSDHFGPVAR